MNGAAIFLISLQQNNRYLGSGQRWAFKNRLIQCNVNVVLWIHVIYAICMISFCLFHAWQIKSVNWHLIVVKCFQIQSEIFFLIVYFKTRMSCYNFFVRVSFTLFHRKTGLRILLHKNVTEFFWGVQVQTLYPCQGYFLWSLFWNTLKSYVVKPWKFMR